MSEVDSLNSLIRDARPESYKDLLGEIDMLRQVELDLGSTFSEVEGYFPVVPDSSYPIWLKILHLPDGWVVESLRTDRFGPTLETQRQVAGNSLIECLCKLRAEELEEE